MKALREWMRDNEKLREIWAVHEYRQVSATAGDQMRDVILAMTDVMEAVEEVRAFRYCPVPDEAKRLAADDKLFKAEATAESVIKEVTG